jgi:L-alanine-DL-glutamate epimerase-like enolase superfamily enzyme
MARIERVNVTAIGPDVPQYRYSGTRPPVFTTTVLVQVTDETGLTGIGAVDTDSFDSYELATTEALCHAAAAAVGADPLRPVAVGQKVRDRLPSSVTATPAAAVEVACWDLLGKRAGQPLYKILGGAREAIPAYASLPFEGSDASVNQVQAAYAAGYRAVKLHVSGTADDDISAIRAVRDAFGDVELMIDVECAYDLSAALRVGRVLDAVGARWFEAPLPDRDIVGYRELRHRLVTPVMPAGGTATDAREIATLLRADPFCALRSEVTAMGGLAATIDLAGLARGFGIELELATYGHALVQAANLAVVLGLGIGSYFEQPFPVEPWSVGVTTSIQIEDGMALPPTAAGLGLELDAATIGSATLRTATLR